MEWQVGEGEDGNNEMYSKTDLCDHENGPLACVIQRMALSLCKACLYTGFDQNGWKSVLS